MTDGSENSSWIGDKCLPTLARIAYSKHYVCLPPLSDKCRILFRNRLTSVFAHVLPDLKGFTYPCDLLQSFTPDAVAMDKDITKSKDSAISAMGKLLKNAKKAKGENKAPLQALALLYSLVIFQLYDGEPDAVSILDELKLCYDGLIRRKESIDSEVDASEVLVELLLSFISKPSALLKRITQHVFSAFMDNITAGGLKLMTDVLLSSESLRGQQELFDQEPEDGQEEDDDEKAEMDSDVEVMDVNREEEHLNGNLHEEDDEDEDEDDEEDEDGDDGSTDDNDEEANKLNDALANVLGTRRLDQDSDGNESDSDADMTDSEMMALDSKLVEIFSQRKKVPNKKQEQKDAKETIVNFKSRVLDLLEIYVKKQATNPLAFGLLLPFLELIRTTTVKQLAGKASNIIQVFAKASKSAKKVEGRTMIQVPELIKLMESIHLEASKDPTHILAKASSTASLLLASSLYRADKESVEKIAKVYKESQVAWVLGKVKMQAAFFIEWVNWCQSHANSQT
jgi:DNA polymerase phi